MKFLKIIRCLYLKRSFVRFNRIVITQNSYFPGSLCQTGTGIIVTGIFSIGGAVYITEFISVLIYTSVFPA